MLNSIKKFLASHITILKRKLKILQTRDMTTPQSRDMDTTKKPITKPITKSSVCPYCLSQNFVKRGFRQKKHEKIQLYLCKNCHKIFTPHADRGKHFPMAAIFDGLSFYHLGYSLEATCRFLYRRHGLTITAPSMARWLSEFSSYCPFGRMRDYALKKYLPKDMVINTTLVHQQLYNYRFHRAKCDLIIQDDFKHRRFGPLQEFLEMVPGDCPHQYFLDGLRASQAPLTFSKTQMIVRAKQNYANRICQFVLQSVKQRKKRHDALQKFMLFNDSVTVATEVPVYITKDDLEHMQTQLGFEMYPKPVSAIVKNIPSVIATPQRRGKQSQPKKIATPLSKLGARDDEVLSLPKLITGHIDFIQIRNGQIHLLDFKPEAAKERPIEQLTLYAMALSRLTGLRLFEFKCAWFDQNDYFEFFPLHVLYKPTRNRRRKIYTREGDYTINQDQNKILSLRPTVNNLKNYVIH